VREQAQALVVGVALPDDVGIAHRQVQCDPAVHGGCHVVQHAVAGIDRIRQAHGAPGRTVLARTELEHPLAAHARIGVVAGGRQRRCRFRGAGPVYRHEGVDAGGRERHDSRTPERFGHHHRHADVHHPGQRGIIGSAELVAGHEHHVLHARVEIGQAFERSALEQVARQAFDAV
jgi:hypothetical protein